MVCLLQINLLLNMQNHSHAVGSSVAGRAQLARDAAVPCALKCESRHQPSFPIREH